MQQQELHDQLGVHGERWSLTPPPGEILFPSIRFLDPAFLEGSLRQVAAQLGAGNLRPIASLWQKHYAAALLIPTVAAMTMAGAGLDLSIGNVSITVDPKGLPRQILLAETAPPLLLSSRWGPAKDAAHSLPELQRFVLEAVREQHLSPLIDQLRAVTGVPRRILWTNCANVIADTFDILARRPEYQRAAAEDRAAWLESGIDLLTGGANPLFGLVRYDSLTPAGLPEVVRVRSACCQRYLLPGYKPCTTCPRLTPAERIAALTEARKQKE